MRVSATGKVFRGALGLIYKGLGGVAAELRRVLMVTMEHSGYQQLKKCTEQLAAGYRGNADSSVLPISGSIDREKHLSFSLVPQRPIETVVQKLKFHQI